MTGRLRIQPWALLVLVAVAGGAEAPVPSQETSVDECVAATSFREMKYICNDGEYDIELQVYSRVVDITCQDTKLNCSRFPSIDLGRNSTFVFLKVTRCAVDEPISCFLAKLNIADAKRLDLWNLLTPLTARHFEGLRATTDFLIYERVDRSVQKTIPYEAIASLPHLKRAEIDGAQLTLAPGPLQAPLLRELDLNSDAISEVPPGFFRGLPSLEKLALEDNSIVEISNDTFAGLDKLRKLNLYGNRISELRGGALSPLRRLETLYIENNPLTRLHDGFLQGLDQLQEIEITSSEPLVLGPRAFADLKSLLYLKLQDSRIQELNGTVFQGSKSVQTVSLKHNQLERLHPEVFRDQTELNTLDLSNNRLANFPQDLFKTLLKLEYLDLSYNQLECLDFTLFSALTSLQTLSLTHNKLGKVSTMGLQGMLRRTPQLPYNRLSFTPEEKTEEYYGTVYCTKYGVRRLQIPDKSVDDLCETGSLLTSPQFGEYPVVGEYVTVDLRNNNISTVFLDSMLFPLQNTQLHFILDHNTLNCDCQTHFFAKLAASSNHSQSIESSRCNVPAWLEGAGLTQVSLDNSVCQVKCPSVCNCTDFSSNRIVEAVCSEVSTEPSRLMDNVSLKFTREPRSLRHLSFKNVVKIDLSGLHLNKVDFETLPETVEILNLSRNNLNYLPKYVLGKDVRLTLSDNPLFCDCWNQQHVAELQQNNASILDYLALRCKDGTLLSQVNIQRICDVWILSATGVSLMVFGVLYAVIIYKYYFEVKIYISKYMPWLLPKEKYDASKKYDVFISYAHQDEDFVRDTLLPKLEGPPISLKTCIHSRDWLAGEMIPYNIAKSVEESRRTVIVLSENFLKSMWGLLEFRTAHVQATKERRTRVVVILLEDVTNREEMDKEMKAYLSTNTYIKWGESWFWEKLAYALPKRGKVVDKREEKRLQAIANKLVKTRLDVQLNNEDS